MKYPNTPEWLESAPDNAVTLYRDLEEFAIKDICRRLKLSGEVTNTALEQIRILKNLGHDQSQIDKYIQKTLNLSKTELEELYERAVERNQNYYEEAIKKADLTNAPISSLDRQEEVEAIMAQTQSEFVNLTQSIGFAIRNERGALEFTPVSRVYQKILDIAELKVWSGVADYNTAIKEAVKQLCEGGMQTVEYASGLKASADVAARRAIMTGINQIADKYDQRLIEELATDLVEVSAHMGARDKGTGIENHKSWQGKVYSLSGQSDKYPSFAETCGYGDVRGIRGANCRHRYFAFVEGVSERVYTDEQLKNIDPEPFEYQGKTYAAYEATQQQRRLESSIRKYKRLVVGYKASGLEDDLQDASIRLKRLTQEYKNFSDAASLRMQPERARIHKN